MGYAGALICPAAGAIRASGVSPEMSAFVSSRRPSTEKNEINANTRM